MTPDAERQRRSRHRRTTAPPYQDVAAQPANLTLEQYREVAWDVVERLVAEFGEAAALRLLNGKPDPRPAPAPADPATVAPPGIRVVPRANQRKGEARLRETSG